MPAWIITDYFLCVFLPVYFQLPNDDLEKNYKSLMKEHMALQKSMMKLQGMLGCRTDPQRYAKVIRGYQPGKTQNGGRGWGGGMMHG